MNRAILQMFYVAARDNKKQVLSIKSQVSGLQTNKQYSTDLSDQFCFRSVKN